MFDFVGPVLSRYRQISTSAEKDDDSTESNSVSEALLYDANPQSLGDQEKPHFYSQHPVLFHSLIFILYIAFGTILLRLMRPDCQCDLLYCKDLLTLEAAATAPRTPVITFLTLAQLPLKRHSPSKQS